MIVLVDVPAESRMEFAALCLKPGLELLACQEKGPEGGNPRYSVAAHNLEALTALGKFYFGPNGDFS